MTRVFRQVLYGCVAAGILGITAMPAAAQRPAPSVPENAPPASLPAEYRVEMVKFHVADESGWDAWGSDEPYWVVSSVGPEGTASTTATKTWENADSGDTFHFRFAPDKGCVYPKDCTSATAPDGIGVSIQLIEVDGGSKAAVVSKTGEYFKKAGTIGSMVDQDPSRQWVYQAAQHVGTALDYIGRYLKDDPLGTQTFAYSRQDLAARLPQPGSSFTEVRRFSGDDGYFTGAADYDLTLRVTRTA